MKKADWEWFPHAGHFICADRCRFRMATNVGNYVVSTVGEFYVRHTDSKPDTIGYDRLYETMVFKRRDKKHPCGCSSWEGSEVDFAPYNTAQDAYAGHMRLCAKWARRK